MTGVRIINKKMLYLKGFPFQFQSKKLMCGGDFFGYYGKVKNISFAKETI